VWGFAGRGSSDLSKHTGENGGQDETRTSQCFRTSRGESKSERRGKRREETEQTEQTEQIEESIGAWVVGRVVHAPAVITNHADIVTLVVVTVVVLVLGCDVMKSSKMVKV
jgi:hypothetical protein